MWSRLGPALLPLLIFRDPAGRPGKRSHRRDKILFPKRRIVQPAGDGVSGPLVRGARPPHG